MPKPNSSDYAAYYEGYINSVEGDNPLQILEDQYDDAIKFFIDIPRDRGTFSYEKGKWSVKEIIGHMIDTERVMAYRALCIARGETKPLPGFDQEGYTASANFNNRSFTSLIDEFKYLRKSNIVLFKSFGSHTFELRGNASNNEVTVNALLYIIAGHCQHHINIIQDRYL